MDILAPNGGKVLFKHDKIADPETHMVTFATGFVDALIDLRLTFNRPMTVTGPARTRVRNSHIGGHPRSMHIYDAPSHGLNGLAALDVYVGDVALTAYFVRLALDTRWSVGVAKTFVHIDLRGLAGLSQAVFGYGS